ncbi:MAG: ribonuclease E/G, partial [Rhodobacteraceae bacterium]|nr:ribonuclease E/G [Paracoccaceae bacterium]
EDLRNLHNPRVELASGGHLIIQPTEALVSIDVNSAKSNQGKTLSETALRTNIEAAKEIARQLRLRDLAGIIVIDFIDMEYQPHRKEVETALRTALRRDQAWINCGYISKLGLLEMTRQRAGENLATNTTKVCPACSGTGRVILDETLAVIILRHIEAECSLKRPGNVQVSVSAPLENYFLNEMRREISRLEDVHGCRIRFETTDNLFSQEYSFILYSADRNKEIFRYPQKYSQNNHNTPKPTWSSKKTTRNSSKTGSEARSYNGNTKISDENNNKKGNNSSNAFIDQIPTDLSATKQKRVTSKPENDLSVNNTSQESESALLVESEQGDGGSAVEKIAKEEKSSKPVKRKRARTKAKQYTPEKETEKEVTVNESAAPAEDQKKESIQADTPEKSEPKVAKAGKETVKQRKSKPKKKPVSKKASQDQDSTQSHGNNEFESTIHQIAPEDETDWDIRKNLRFYSPSDLE